MDTKYVTVNKYGKIINSTIYDLPEAQKLAAKSDLMIAQITIHEPQQPPPAAFFDVMDNLKMFGRTYKDCSGYCEAIIDYGLFPKLEKAMKVYDVDSRGMHVLVSCNRWSVTNRDQDFYEDNWPDHLHVDVGELLKLFSNDVAKV